MTRIEFPSLEAWEAHCRLASTNASDGDRAVLSSDWSSAGITPPPARGSPEARIPLETAGRLVEESSHLEGRARVERLEEAVAWLETPHPRTPSELLAAMRRRRDRLLDEINDRR